MTPQPLISVITVCYNAADNLARTMQSVAAQTSHDHEHIIVDGASKDTTENTVTRLSTPRTRFYSEKDNGIYDAMNKGLGLARGKYVLFLNAGDTFAGKDTLERYTQAISDNDMPGIVYGQTVLTDKNRTAFRPRHLIAPQALTLDSFKNGMTVCHQAFCALLRIAPLYDTRWRFSADYEWCIRCLQHSHRNIYLGDKPVIHYLDEGATTANRRASLVERYKIMCRYYGTVATTLRHVKFMFRFLSQKRK